MILQSCGSNCVKSLEVVRRTISIIERRRQQFSTLTSKTGPPKARVFYTTGDDIHVNLAAESFMVEALRPILPTLFLWRNNKTIVIGRHQNPWTECNLQKMEMEGVALARRYSGGGAVYHDLGNTCFSFISPRRNFAKELNNNIIVAGLKSLGIEAECSGRNDLTSLGKKFSGAAFHQIGDCALHHGTLMLHVDIQGLQNFLTPNKLKLMSKGITSVASRVINLRDISPGISHETVSEAIVREFLKTYEVSSDEVETRYVDTDEEINASEVFKRHLDTLRAWDWRFGTTPQFSHKFEGRFDWGTFTVHLDVCNGRIENAKIFSDCLDTALVEALEAATRNVKYSAKELKERTAAVKCANRSLCIAFGDWIASEIYEAQNTKE